MKVKELIKYLSQLNQESELFIKSVDWLPYEVNTHINWRRGTILMQRVTDKAYEEEKERCNKLSK